jgi:PAS domain S-box-containing protein
MIERSDLLAAVEQAAEGVVITDTSGKIQYVNPAFTTLTGYTCEEAVGQPPASSNRGARRRRFTKSSGMPSVPDGPGTAN